MAKLKFGDTSSCPAMHTSSSGSSTDFSKVLKGTSSSSITIPSDVTTLRNYAFYNYTGLNSINLNNVTSIGSYAFYNTSLSSISFPNDGTTIGSYAFANIIGLYNINLNNVTSIDNNAFSGSHVATLNIPDTVTSIATNAFYNCNYLTSINVDQTIGSISGAPWGATNATVTWKESEQESANLTFVFPDTTYFSSLNIGGTIYYGSSITNLQLTVPLVKNVDYSYQIHTNSSTHSYKPSSGTVNISEDTTITLKHSGPPM